jgi:hypothetical protein
MKTRGALFPLRMTTLDERRVKRSGTGKKKWK